jgi:tRNA (guanine-N7-)-methyltransferase
MSEQQKLTNFTNRIKTFMPRTSPLNSSQKHGLLMFSSKYQLNIAQGPLNQQSTFGRDAPLTIEIGFGMGQSLVAMAQAMPERDFIGIEIHKPGMAQLCFDAGNLGLNNLRYYGEDAVQVLEQVIDNNSVDTVQLFFPDPWQKARHHKRRFVRPDLIALVRTKLRIGGRFHMATDWQPYAEWMLEHMEAAPGFCNAHAPGQYYPRPDWRPLTKFEQRGNLAGHGVWDLIYTRES